MGLFTKMKEKTWVQMVTERGNGMYVWNGKVYQSDIVRACIHPKVNAVGKLVAKHIREGAEGIKVNPEPYIRFLLEDPNPYMSMQKLLEKLAIQREINRNAFALIMRDENGFPNGIYPLPATGVECIYSQAGELFLKFTFQNGNLFTFRYSDVIHLRTDFSENDIFGDPIAPALAPLMNIVGTTDRGIINAVKNSGVIRWLLKFHSATRPEDVENETKRFAQSFLGIDSQGVAGVDTKADAQQIEPKDYVPNAAQMDRTTQRIYSLFGTNEKIVQSRADEDEWNAYYESEIEPIVVELAAEFTRKLFTRRERGCGNRVVFQASNLSTASMSTKLNLCQMVDRGAMTPNEWREVLNLAPIEGGDKPIRRLDTQPVEGGEKE